MASLSVECVRGIGRPESILGQCRSDGLTIVAIATLVQGITVHGVPGDEAVGGDVVGDLGDQGAAGEPEQGKQVSHAIGLVPRNLRVGAKRGKAGLWLWCPKFEACGVSRVG